ncbi:MAG: hypothetical protein U0K54_00590 [Acutalibacteraceae bacterium]|nr:hypothetical protein [Acutalibacteraceae bacterium]
MIKHSVTNQSSSATRLLGRDSRYENSPLDCFQQRSSFSVPIKRTGTEGACSLYFYVKGLEPGVKTDSMSYAVIFSADIELFTYLC